MSEKVTSCQPSSEWAAGERCDLTAPDGVTAAVVEAASTVIGCTPFDLSPIAETIDPDALESFIRAGDAECVVQFVYEGLDVRVDGRGRVSVRR